MPEKPAGAQASDALPLTLSKELVRLNFPRPFLTKIFGRSVDWEQCFQDHLRYGDTRAAVVISSRPLRIACYSDEIDDSAVLEFKPTVAVRHGPLEVGDRLLTVNGYYNEEEKPVKDLVHGVASYHRYLNFTPYIAEFMSEDYELISVRKGAISEDEWERCIETGQAYLERSHGKCREGTPYYAGLAAD